MKVKELADMLQCMVVSEGNSMEREITGGYTSDLLSDVMGNAEEGMLWITLQVHRNTIAVAALKELAAVLLIGSASLDEETAALAAGEGVTVLSTGMTAFEASGRIYRLLDEQRV